MSGWTIDCEVSEASVPFERTVTFADASGVEQELQVDAANLAGEGLGPGLLRVYPVSSRDDHVLVGLPAETASGGRRVWVEASRLRPEAEGVGHDPVRS